MPAKKDDWIHWDVMLGLGADLLPVAPAGSPPTKGSKIAKFGKVPSALTPDGRAYGISKWQSREISPVEVEQWSQDARLSLCVRCRTVRAIDIDIDDVHAQAVADIVADFFVAAGASPVARTRPNSHKRLFPFRLEGAFSKRSFKTGTGLVEFLADGQQFVAAGSHESGVEYQWSDGGPADIPTLTSGQFEELWSTLVASFAVEPQKATAPVEAKPQVLATSIPEADLELLQAALRYPPLVSSASLNDVWAEIGYALLSTQQFELWDEFCKRAPNYKEGDSAAWWAAHRDQEPRTDYTHIVKMAKELGFKMVDFGQLTDEELQTNDEDEFTDLLGTLPARFYETTDHSNAHRINDKFGGRKVIVVHGVYHSWTGKKWIATDSEAHRCAAALSGMLKVEIENAQAQFDALAYANKEWADLAFDTIARPDQSLAVKQFKATPAGAAILGAKERIDRLRKWQYACESWPTMRRAVEELRTVMEPYDPIALDAPKHLFNVSNGTIDLRSGLLLPHDPRNLLTKISRLDYDPDAKCPIFETFILDIFAGDEELVAFMQRWFGYALTGETSEQKLLLHIGGGSNGKSTLLETISRVMGEYAKTAAPNLLTSQVDRHPTEIAELFGRRLVTAHESDDGAILRESFIKQATGGDPLSGRFMRENFFEFLPTHKLQLLTNHKPQVRGQDHAIWRRLLLVWYQRRYGSKAEVEAGSAHAEGDPTLSRKLELEHQGILAWMVRGAVEWYKSGLRPPQSVLDAGREYRDEQDRIAMFIEERCIYEPAAWTPSDDLFQSYVSWAKGSGYNSFGKLKFLSELERVMGPQFKGRTVKRIGKSVCRGVGGIMLDPDGGGVGARFVRSSEAEDLL